MKSAHGCKKCHVNTFVYKIKDWEAIKKFLKEFKANFLDIDPRQMVNEKDSLKIMKDEYIKIHQNGSLKYLLSYILKKWSCSMSFEYLEEKMYARHVFYKNVYDWELQMHDNNQKQVLTSFRQKIGTSIESFAILDFKEPPTWITKISLFADTVFDKLPTKSKMFITISRITAVVFDLLNGRDIFQIYRKIDF